jgi:hypothetical protein
VRRAPALALALALVGSITLTHASAPSISVRTVEVPFGKIVAGSSVGANATNGSVSIAGRIVLGTDNVLYVNNTHSTDALYVKLSEWSVTGLGGVTTINVGIDNGTSTDQVKISLGSVTQASGAYVRLAPSSTNRIYVQSLVVALSHTTPTVISLDAYVADDLAESAYYTMRAAITVT